MLGVYRSALATCATALAAVLAMPLLGPGSTVDAAEATREITVKITRVKPLDRADSLSEAEYYGEVTINGTLLKSEIVKTGKAFTPNWTFATKVPGGVQKLKIDLKDKDIVTSDPIDINRIDKRRTLEFTVDTASCDIEGFAQSYSCGDKITRAGTEKRRAEITFTVNVK